MEVEARFRQLERQHDWEGARQALEQAIAGAGEATEKAALHLRLGRLLRDQFLQGVTALKHFQDAYKLDSALVESLSEAREIYWHLGKLSMVQKLVALELKADTERKASGRALPSARRGAVRPGRHRGGGRRLRQGGASRGQALATVK